MNKLRLGLLLLLCLAGLFAKAQTVNPVQVNSTILQPAPIYLSDYTAFNTSDWRVALKLNDFNAGQRDVKVKLKITGQNFTITTNDQVSTDHQLSLFAGELRILEGADLEPYLSLQNIDMLGGSLRSLPNGRLPEGLYEFSVEVFDVLTGEKLSNINSQPVWLQLNDAPVMNYPMNGDLVNDELGAYINFQWQQANITSPTAFEQVYQLTIFEVLDPRVDPQVALSNGQVQQVFKGDWQSTTNYTYGIDEVPLRSGYQYIAYVQAKESLTSNRDLYKNNGYSEIIYFYYGHPENGGIQLLKPNHHHSFAKKEDQIFQWSPPDNLLQNQLVNYQLVIVEIQDGQNTETAIADNAIWYQETLENNQGEEDITFKLNKLQQSFKKGQSYAWKIIADIEGKQIAESNTNIFYGPPIIDKLYVGDYEVEITRLDSIDLNHLYGSATFNITKDGSQTVSATFQDIQVKPFGGSFYLIGGEIIAELQNELVTTLTPELEENGEASFNASKAKLSIRGLELYGNINWELALITETIPYFITQQNWIDYNKYTITGTQNINQENKHDLIIPNEYSLTVESTSKLAVINNTYYVHADGYVIPKDAQQPETINTQLHFKNQQQLTYMTIGEYKTAHNISLGSNFTALPNQCLIDLSEKQSPNEFSPEWMGIVVSNFDLQTETYKDQNINLSFDELQKITYVNLGDNKMNLYLDGTGIHSLVNIELQNQNITPKFNTFPSYLSTLHLEIKNSSISNSKLSGEFQIPFLSEKDWFTYLVPITQEGYYSGYLDEKIDGKTYIINKGNKANEIQLTINRAVFENNDHLTIESSLEWKELDIKIDYLDNLMIWGNYNVGFGEPNGSQYLAVPLIGDLSGYERTTKIIGAGRTKNLYSIGFQSEINYGEDIGGADGAPVVNSYSIFESSVIPEDYRLSTLPSNDDELLTIDSDLFAQQDGTPIQVDLAEENALLDLAFAELEEQQEFEGKVEFELTANNTKEYSNNHYLIENDPFADDSEVTKVGIEEIKLVLDLAVLITKDEDKKVKYIQLKERIESNQEDIQEVYKELVASGFSINKLLKSFTDIISDKLSNTVNSKIDTLTGKINQLIDQQLEKAVDKVFVTVDPAFEKIKTTIVGSFKEEDQREKAKVITDTVINAFKNSLKLEITEALQKSVNENITSKVELFVDHNLKAQIDFYIKEKVGALGYAIIDGNLNETLDTLGLVKDGAKLVETFADTLFQEIKSINGDQLNETLEKVCQDFIQNISWNRIAQQMAKEILGKSAEQFVKDKAVELITKQASELLGNEHIGDNIQNLASNVNLNFNNLGKNIKEGNLKENVSFDPSTIVVKTKVAEFTGTIKLYKGDPVWGDCFKGNIQGSLKKPAIDVKAVYTNGQVDGFKFWYLELAVPSGLNAPLVPGLKLDGIGGKVFSKMSYDLEADEYRPDQENKYGAGLQMWCVDAVSGNQVKLSVLAELAFMQDYYTFQIRGEVGIGFQGKEERPKLETSAMLYGKGHITFSSKDNTVIGQFIIKTNMKPILCLNGTLDLFLSKDKFALNIGTREAPISAKMLCLIKLETYLMVSDKEVELGVMSDVAISAESPWFRIPIKRDIKPYVRFAYDLDALINVQLKPKLKLQEALLDLYVYAGVGVEWRKNDKSGNWELVAGEFHGKAHYYNTTERSFISGRLAGRIAIVGISFGVDLNLNKDLKARA